MKTVVDAVNELEGDLNNCFYGFDSREKLVCERKDDGVITTLINPNDAAHLICTVDEFNQCVAEMSEAKWMHESKPIFTQAMADARELPPVGSLFIDLEFNTKKPVLAIAHHLGNVVYAADYDDTMKVEYMHAEQSECKPIKSEREKTIDEMLVIAIESKDDIAKSIVYEACVKLRNANYRKLTPSQAKAYDDKTEYFGEDYK